jgi:hypothetical protein
MKQIFSETTTAATWAYPVVRGGFSADEVWVDWREGQATTTITAHYDAKRWVLVVDCEVKGVDLPENRVLETVETEAAAIRRAIAAADAWMVLVASVAPASHPAIAADNETLAVAELGIIAAARADNRVEYPLNY